MSEGEFKRRLVAQREFGDVTLMGRTLSNCLVHKDDVAVWVDHARKDIFSNLHIERGRDTRRTDIENVSGLLLALFKWFGDVEKNEARKKRASA